MGRCCCIAFTTTKTTAEEVEFAQEGPPGQTAQTQPGLSLGCAGCVRAAAAAYDDDDEVSDDDG